MMNDVNNSRDGAALCQAWALPPLDEGVENSDHGARSYGDAQPEEFLARIHCGGELVLERPWSILGLKSVAGKTQRIENKIRVEKRKGKGSRAGDRHALQLRRKAGLGFRGIRGRQSPWNRRSGLNFLLSCRCRLLSPQFHRSDATHHDDDEKESSCTSSIPSIAAPVVGDAHCLAPKIAVPMRTMVEPSSMAIS